MFNLSLRLTDLIVVDHSIPIQPILRGSKLHLYSYKVLDTERNGPYALIIASKQVRQSYQSEPYSAMTHSKVNGFYNNP